MATAAEPDKALTARQILANVKAMAPRIAERSREIEALRRLPGDLVGDLLVLGDRVADLHVPGDDLRFGNALADVRQLELIFRHQSAITFSSAVFMRFGPGKYAHS